MIYGKGQEKGTGGQHSPVEFNKGNIKSIYLRYLDSGHKAQGQISLSSDCSKPKNKDINRWDILHIDKPKRLNKTAFAHNMPEILFSIRFYIPCECVMIKYLIIAV